MTSVAVTHRKLTTTGSGHHEAHLTTGEVAREHRCPFRGCSALAANWESEKTRSVGVS